MLCEGARIAGTWGANGARDVTVTPFGRLSRPVRAALDGAIERVAEAAAA